MSAPFCPICRNIFIRSRMYECGHTLCELCMVETDRHTEVPDAYTAVAYRCPVCRAETLVPWMRRPKNVALENVCSSLFPEDYKERLESAGDPIETKKLEVDRNINLAHLAIAERESIAAGLYDEIFPILHKTAKDGGDFVSITSPKKVHSIYRVADQLCPLLFKHKIFRILCTPDEVTIHILKRGTHSRNEFTNSNYEAPLVSIVSSETTLESLSNISNTIQSLVPISPRYHLRPSRLLSNARRSRLAVVDTSTSPDLSL